MERRLTAILAADVVGYSRLMGVDEAGTLAALKAQRKELIEPKLAQYHGRTIKLMGDGALMEFPSVVEAVSFAVEIQLAMPERNADSPEQRRILYRIGINIGDIIVEGDDIFGDGVNVASRLEGLAEPGGICVARNVHDQVRDKLDLDLNDLGEVEVKNIARPVHAYRVVLNAKADVLVTPVQPLTIEKTWRSWPIVVSALALAVVAVAALFAWWQPWITRLAPASVAKMTFPLPDKPSIAVLPFDNLTGDPAQGHIADGMSETIISTLSRIPELFVIARNSSFTYKGKAVKIQQVAEDLGVRYVLEGSVQRADEVYRITVQLIDALEGHHLWSESYDRKLADLFELQDDIALKTTVALQVKLTTGEEARMLSRTTKNVRAWTLYQQALSNLFKFSKDGSRNARRLAQDALAEDSRFADAMIVVGFTHLIDARTGYSSSPQESLKLAIQSADEARALAPDAPNLFNLMQSIYRFQGRFDEAVAAGERAIELSPNSAISLLATAMTANLAGQFERSVELARKAIRQSPHQRSAGQIWLARSLWFKREYAEALSVANEGLQHAESPYIAGVHLLNLALVHAETGDMDKARQAVREIEEKAPRLTLSFIESGFRFKNDSDWQRLASALRSAGFPE